jgi:hypothetical protein
MFLMPTGVGEPRQIQAGDLHLLHAAWLPDQKRLVVSAHEPGRGIRLYQLHLDSGEYEPFTPEGMDYLEFRVLPNGTEVCGINGDEDHWIYPIDGSPPRPLAMLGRTERVVRWLPDGQSLLAYHLNQLPARIERLDVVSGERSLWREIMPPDPTGIFRIARVRTNADGTTYGYVYFMHLVDLHVLSGPK